LLVALVEAHNTAEAAALADTDHQFLENLPEAEAVPNPPSF
jgi:hypothetical protein